MIIKKITIGFVIQTYDMEQIENGQAKCIGQDFIAGDEITYESMTGDEPLNLEDIESEFNAELDYQPYLMIQPKR